MKIIAAALLVLAASAAALAQGAPLPVLPGETAALYVFDDGTGTTVADKSGNGHDGVLYGTPRWISTAQGMGVDFAGPQDMMWVPAIAIGTTWTIQVWTRFPLAPIGDRWPYRTLTNSNDWQQQVGTDDANSLGATVPMSWNPANNGALPDGWHLLSAVGADGHTTFYVDDLQVGDVLSVQETNAINYIGNYWRGSENWGAIDSMRILTVVRSAAEIGQDFLQSIPSPPSPQGPLQYALNGLPLGQGAQAHGDGFIVEAAVSDPNGPFAQLQVEVKGLGLPFDGTTALFGSNPVDSGAKGAVQVSGLALGSYHWRCRALGSHAKTSDWVEGGTPGSANLELVNLAPVAAVALQLHAEDSGAMGVGAKVFDAGGIRFQAVVNDPDGDAVRFQVELRPVGVPFSGVATGEGPRVPAGAVATCLHPVGTGPQHWQARAVDEYGATSAWVAFGGNPEGEADFSVAFNGSAGTKSCTGSAAGAGAWLVLLGLVGILLRR